MTRLVADELKMQIKAFDHRLDLEIKKKALSWKMVITASGFNRYTLDKLFEIVGSRSCYIEPNQEMRGYIDFVIY